MWAAHQRAWLDAQQPVTDRHEAGVFDLFDQLAEALAREAEQAGIEHGLARFDPNSESPKLRTVATPAPFPDLREAVAALAAGRGRTALEDRAR